ncbi:MAG: hypothetical protein KDG54_00960 [Geminicoccaceae bacterium]|nr:hypothetical protein [Geminicoccaceae bacterium]
MATRLIDRRVEASPPLSLPLSRLKHFTRQAIHLIPARRREINVRRYPLPSVTTAADHSSSGIRLTPMIRRQTVLLAAALLFAPTFGAGTLLHAVLAALFITSAGKLVLAPSTELLERQAEVRPLSPAFALLPIIVGLLLGRGFLLLAVMIIGLDIARAHFHDRPAIHGFIQGMVWALTAEAGGVAVGADIPMSFSLAAAATGVLLAIENNHRVWRMTRIEAAPEQFMRQGSVLLLTAAGLATIITMGNPFSADLLDGLVSLLASSLLLGAMARILHLLDNDRFGEALDDAPLAALSTSLLVVMAALGHLAT